MAEFSRRTHTCDTDCEVPDNPLCAIGERVSEESADRAVKKVFAILGVDIHKPESVEEFREDLRFGKRLRKLANHGTIVLVGLLFTGLAWAALEGFINRLRGG
jgi:hypothetical protein